jgi:hypothetical protein
MKHEDYIPPKTVKGFLESLTKRHQIPADNFELYDEGKYQKMILVYHYQSNNACRVIYDDEKLTERMFHLEYLRQNMRSMWFAEPRPAPSIYRRIILE